MDGADGNALNDYKANLDRSPEALANFIRAFSVKTGLTECQAKRVPLNSWMGTSRSGALRKVVFNGEDSVNLVAELKRVGGLANDPLGA